jgi:hypothetical protein
MEFHILDAPHIVVKEPPPALFVEKGIKGPYRTWFNIEGWTANDPFTKTTSRCLLTGVKESVDYVLSYMKEHGPFDGFVTFSGG